MSPNNKYIPFKDWGFVIVLFLVVLTVGISIFTILSKSLVEVLPLLPFLISFIFWAIYIYFKKGEKFSFLGGLIWSIFVFILIFFFSTKIYSDYKFRESALSDKAGSLLQEFEELKQEGSSNKKIEVEKNNNTTDVSNKNEKISDSLNEAIKWRTYNYKTEGGISVSFLFPSYFTPVYDAPEGFFEYCDKTRQSKSTSDFFFCKNGGVYYRLGIHTLNENITQELIDSQGSATNYIGKSNLNNRNKDLVWISQIGGKDDRAIEIVKNYNNNKAIAILFYGYFYSQQNEPFRVSEFAEQILNS